MLIGDVRDESRLVTSLEFREEVWGGEFSPHVGY